MSDRRPYVPYFLLTLEFARSEVNNQLVKPVPGDDIVVIIELLFTLGDDDLAITLCYPQKAITPILTSLSTSSRLRRARRLPARRRFAAASFASRFR